MGKTVVAAAIAHGLAANGERIGVFKPAVTGLDEAGESDHALLRRAAGSGQGDAEIAPYRYRTAASPHLAAALVDEQLDPRRLRLAAAAAAENFDALICEGVGGLLVPLSPHYLVRDLAVDLGLPIVIAAPTGLGTINHTLLTIEAARRVGLDIAAVVLTPWPPRPNRIERSNRQTIASLGQVSVKTLARLDLSNPDSWPAVCLDALSDQG